MIVMKSNIRRKKGNEERQCRNWKKIEIVAGKEDNAAVAMMKKKLQIQAIPRGKANDDDDDLYLPIPGIYPPSHPQLPKWSHSWIELMV